MHSNEIVGIENDMLYIDVLDMLNYVLDIRMRQLGLESNTIQNRAGTNHSLPPRSCNGAKMTLTQTWEFIVDAFGGPFTMRRFRPGATSFRSCPPKLSNLARSNKNEFVFQIHYAKTLFIIAFKTFCWRPYYEAILLQCNRAAAVQQRVHTSIY